MFIKQLSVFVENKSGRLAEITAVLAGAGIDIRALSIADTTNFGILRIIVDKPFEAETALKEAGLTVSLTSVLAIGIPDEPAGRRRDEGSGRRRSRGRIHVRVHLPRRRAGLCHPPLHAGGHGQGGGRPCRPQASRFSTPAEFIPCKRKSSLHPAGSFLPLEIDRIRRWGLIHTGLRAILNKRAEQPPEKSGGCS